MLPTIGPDDLCVANPSAYWLSPVARFDLVVFKAPEGALDPREFENDVRYIKRVIGLPNEKIEIRNNVIFVNDVPLIEPFDKIVDEKDRKRNFPAIIIPEEEYFLLGDNRPNSLDSRSWKTPTVNRRSIYSKIVDIKKDFYKEN
jgi:signal peptidase I